MVVRAVVVLKVGYTDTAASAAVKGGAEVGPASREREQSEKHFLGWRLKLNWTWFTARFL